MIALTGYLCYKQALLNGAFEMWLHYVGDNFNQFNRFSLHFLAKRFMLSRIPKDQRITQVSLKTIAS